ncbi:hypothetical protein DFH06DRAFT_1143211 [Mycena polygramma]|nr:hypothetical protein DFH06DRAFT_1143211 [Mycena polygramma]
MRKYATIVLGGADPGPYQSDQYFQGFSPTPTVLSMPRLSQLIFSMRRLLKHSRYKKLPFHLPMELWEIVFEQLGGDSLLSAATVCWGWNYRCLRLYLQASIPSSSHTPISVPLESVSPSSLQLHHIDRAPITWLSRVDVGEMIQDMQHLGNIISRSPNIQQITLSFRRNLSFDSTRASAIGTRWRRKHRGQWLWLSPTGTYALLTAAMSPSGLVATFSLRNQITRQCYTGLRKTKKEGPLPRQSLTSDFPSSSGIGATEPNFFTCMPGQSFTLINYDDHQPWTLNIGCPRNIVTEDIWASSEQLKAVLPYIHLPTVRSIYVGIAIDPIAFTQFLKNHDGILYISLDRVLAEEPYGEMLTEYPVVLPKLTGIYLQVVDDLIPLLNSFSWPKSNTCTITIPFDPLRADISALRRALRRLSQHTSEVKLHLCGLQLWDFSMFLNDEDRLTANGLDCVVSLHVEVATEADIRTLIPWIACLPRLQCLTGTTRRVSSEYGRLESLNRENQNEQLE